MSKAVAFLGLGVMGGPMAANLARQGVQVKAWNRTPGRPGIAIAAEAGAIIVPTLAAAVTDVEIIFTCLGDVPDVEEVLLGDSGVINYAASGTLIVDFSTIGPKAACHLAKELATKGLRFLDAPVSGGDVGAQKGTLTIMVGGEEADFQTCLPFFQLLGKTIRYCGPVGRGQSVKLCNQILGALHMVALCEAMELAKQQQLDPELIVEVCSSGAAGSWALSNLGPKIIASDLAPGFMIKHILKDLRLVREIGEELPGVALAESLFQTVGKLDQGLEQGTQAMIRAYRD